MNVVSVFDKAVIDGDNIEIDGDTYYIKKGKHSLWIPEKEMKIVWSYNGKITSFKDWDKGSDAEEIKNDTFNKDEYWDQESLDSIKDEHNFFYELSKVNFSPPTIGLFYIQHVISDFFGENMLVDKKGVFGHHMKDANNLSEGKWNFDKFIELFYDRLVISDWTRERTDINKGKFGGAFGDLLKDDNTVNGYIIDIRRTLWDTLKLKEEN